MRRVIQRNASPRWVRQYFVSFSETPNEQCYKFCIEGVKFIPRDERQRVTSVFTFDRRNSFQSPLAESILDALPSVAEVTIGEAFVTVRKLDSDEEEEVDLMVTKFTSLAGNAESKTVSTVDILQTSAAANLDTSASAGTAEAGHVEDGDIHAKIRQLGKTDEDGVTELDADTLRQLVEKMDWAELKTYVCALLTDHMFSGEPHIRLDAPHPHADTLPCEGDSEVVLAVKELLSESVRPLVQQDGGDVRFLRFEADEGRVVVELLGACKTCKSSSTTLRDLIERTLRHWIPEVKSVEEQKLKRPPTPTAAS